MASGALSTVRRQTTRLPGLAGQVSTLLGIRLTSYLSGAGSPEEFATWLTKPDDLPDRSVESRLRLTLSLADLFRRKNAATMLVPWLRRNDSRELDGQAPARVIRGPLDHSAQKQLRAVAERFLEGLASTPKSAAFRAG